MMIPELPCEDLERMPGLYRLWELSQVILPRAIYRIEDAGLTKDGAALFAIYQVIVSVMVQ